MFYKFATAFACFFVLGQAMADENIAGKGKGAEEQGPIGAVSKDAAKEQGPIGAVEDKAVSEEQGPLGPAEGKAGAGEQGPVGPEEQGPVGPEEQGPLGPEEQGPLGPAMPEEQGPLGPAVPDEQGPAKGPARTEFPVATATFDELKLACVDPARFHFQLPPGNIRIACESRQTAWVQDGNGAVTGDCTRTVTGQLYSNKIVIGEQQYSFAVPPNDLSCPRFKEVINIFRSEYGTTCEEILGYNDLGHFCQERLSSDPNAIPELVVVEDTGRTLDTCVANVSGGK